MFRCREILMNIQLFASISNKLSPEKMKMYIRYDFVFYLNLQVLDELYS